MLPVLPMLPEPLMLPALLPAVLPLGLELLMPPVGGVDEPLPGVPADGALAELLWRRSSAPMRSLTLARSCFRREISLPASLLPPAAPPASVPAPETALLLGLVGDDAVVGGGDTAAPGDVLGVLDAGEPADALSG